MSNELDQAAGLRANAPPLSQLAARKAITCLAVASGKGGVGKTFVSVNLAVAMAQQKRKVLLVDADLGLANADIQLGANPEFTLQDAVFRGKPFNEVVTHTPHGVDLLAASSGSSEMVSMGAARIGLIIQDLLTFAADYDVLIFDCASGINSGVTCFLQAAPMNLIVANPSPTSIMDVYALLKVIHQRKLSDSPGLIVNMVQDNAQGKKVHEALNHVGQLYLSSKMKLVGMIPESQAVQSALTQRLPIVAKNPNHEVSDRFRQMAKSLASKMSATTKLGNLDVENLVQGMLAEKEEKKT